MAVYDDNPLPNPTLTEVDYADVLSPELWNTMGDEIDANFGELAAGRPLIVDSISDLQVLPTPRPQGQAEGRRMIFALVLSEMALFVYIEGEADVAISELGFTSTLRKVRTQGGVWCQLAGAAVLQHVTETQSLGVAQSATSQLFSRGLDLYSDGARPTVVTVNCDEVIRGGFCVLYILSDGIEKVTVQIESGPISHLSVLDLPEGDHTITARLLAQGGQGGIVVGRRTMTARVG